ncbi:MAG: hypothetical protein HONDAALG_01514 [Gammaproteobacteria bacterium]|nr:hypothetical protein [Gammaproteobacteria bacterium]
MKRYKAGRSITLNLLVVTLTTVALTLVPSQAFAGAYVQIGDRD